MRERYLYDELELWKGYIAGVVEPFGPMPYADMPTIEKELLGLATAREPVIKRSNEVTPQMIEQARQVPVDTLIEFTHGKCHCPFHDDKIPSMFHGTRENRAVCPSGCNDSWDSIGLTQKLDGLSFHDAVRKLCK
jgi:hypothetical protein